MFDFSGKFTRAFLRDSRYLTGDVRMREPYEYYKTKGGKHLVLSMKAGEDYRFWDFRMPRDAIRCLHWKLDREKVRPGKWRRAWQQCKWALVRLRAR